MRLSARPVLGRLGGAEVAILVASALGAVGVLWFPGQVGSAAGSGSEIAFVLDAVVMTASLLATLAVVSRHPGRRCTALTGEILVPALAPVVSLAMAALDTALAALVLSASSVTIAVNFLPLTPLWAVELLLLAPAAYAALLGVESLARALDLAAPVTLFVLLVTCLFTASQARFGTAMLSRVPAVGGWPAVLMGAYAGVWALGGLTIVPNVCAQISREQAPRLRSRVMAGALSAVAISLGLLVLDLAVLGVTGLSWYEWPTISVLRQTRTEAFLINRVSGLDEWVLVVMVWAFVGLHLWNAGVNVIDAIAQPARGGLRGTARPSNNVLVAGVITLLVYLICRLFGSGTRLDRFSATYLDPAVVALVLVLPITLWAIDGLRRRAGRGPA